MNFSPMPRATHGQICLESVEKELTRLMDWEKIISREEKKVLFRKSPPSVLFTLASKTKAHRRSERLKTSVRNGLLLSEFTI